MDPSILPLHVYGASISYYTGKFEAYLRYKEIPYENVAFGPKNQRKIREAVHATQLPTVELADGRFLTDTTPMIAWFEEQQPEPPVIPTDPLQSFFSRLVEDYAEEWLWRPAMHYRWSYRADRLHLGRKIVDEMLSDIPAPGLLKRFFIRNRQHWRYVKLDGVDRTTWKHVEGVYLKSLDQLEAIFQCRPYLLGDVPTLADFGFFASMFRHFAQDPTASSIMRVRAPAVHEWQARLWNARASRTRGSIVPGIPEDWSPILDEMGSAYFPFLNANAIAWASRQRNFDAEIQGTPYRRMPVSQYRVWCLEELRRHYEELPEGARAEARSRLERHGCWEPLFKVANLDSQYDPEGRAPFYGQRVHYDNT